MHCAIHQELAAVAFCRECGRGVCVTCRRETEGIVYCEDCWTGLYGVEPEPVMTGSQAGEVPEAAYGIEPGGENPIVSSGQPQPTPRDGAAAANEAPSPPLAFILGLIPGVGAVYNGQYPKAVLQVLIFGGLIGLLDSSRGGGLKALLVPSMILFLFYMPLDSLRTARALRRGDTVDEFSGLFSLRGLARSSPAAGIAFIVAGIVFLLLSLGYWDVRDIVPFWPAILIALGVYMVYQRIISRKDEEEATAQMYDEPSTEPHP